MIFEILIGLSTSILGIFLGAQLTEAVLFVPYWKTLPAKDFFELHQIYGKKIYQFFAPLTILATLTPVLTMLYGLSLETELNFPLILMGTSTILFFSTYFLYFKEANKSFAEASIPAEALPTALNKWGNWHWGRILFECIAFAASIVLILGK
jgi:hypothetical protein